MKNIPLVVSDPFMSNPFMKRPLLLFAMISIAALWFSGCGESPESVVRKKLFSPSPDKDVTASPEYNFSSLAGTVWKTRTKTAIGDAKIYTGAHTLALLPPDRFDPTDTNYGKIPDLKLIAVLPPGARLRITRLMKDRGAWGGVQVEGVVEDGTNAPKTVYVDRLFLFANPRWASYTNWGVNLDMLAPSGDSGLSAPSSPEIGDTPQAGYKKGYAYGKSSAILANNALPRNKQAAVKGLSDPWLGLESRPVAVMIYGEGYVVEYESGYRKGFHDHFEEK
jgi:hypothetical protein